MSGMQNLNFLKWSEPKPMLIGLQSFIFPWNLKTMCAYVPQLLLSFMLLAPFCSTSQILKKNLMMSRQTIYPSICPSKSGPQWTRISCSITASKSCYVIIQIEIHQENCKLIGKLTSSIKLVIFQMNYGKEDVPPFPRTGLSDYSCRYWKRCKHYRLLGLLHMRVLLPVSLYLHVWSLRTFRYKLTDRYTQNI